MKNVINFLETLESNNQIWDLDVETTQIDFETSDAMDTTLMCHLYSTSNGQWDLTVGTFEREWNYEGLTFEYLKSFFEGLFSGELGFYETENC